MRRTALYIIIVLGFIASACNLERPVDIELPEYESEVVAESYLQVGQPYLVILSKSVGFLDDIQLVYERDATVTITSAEGTVELIPFEFALDDPALGGVLDSSFLASLTPILGEDLFFYSSLEVVPELYDSDFLLEITTADSTKLSARTQIPAPVELEPAELRFNEDSMAFILTKFQDNPDQVNFYRRILQLQRTDIRERDNGTVDTVYVDRIEQDFTVDDEITNGELITFGSTFDYREGDTLTSTIFHVTGDFSRYIETRDAAIAASQSPFGQPTIIFSNIEGGQGIFTGMSEVSQTVIVGE